MFLVIFNEEVRKNERKKINQDEDNGFHFNLLKSKYNIHFVYCSSKVYVTEIFLNVCFREKERKAYTLTLFIG
jgi:hypothetical protein